MNSTASASRLKEPGPSGKMIAGYRDGTLDGARRRPHLLRRHSGRSAKQDGVAPLRHGSLRDAPGSRTGGLVGIDECEMDRALAHEVPKIPLDPPRSLGLGHRNATARKANSAIVIPNLLIVCSQWSRFGKYATESTNTPSAARTRAR